MRDLTESENIVLRMLADAWETALRLPDHHPADMPDFARAINAAQSIIFARPAVEAQPDLVGPGRR